MKKGNKQFIFLFIIFILGIGLGMMSSSNSLDQKIDDFEENIKNPDIMPYPIENINSNIFIKTGKKGEEYIKKSFNLGINGIGNAFKSIFGL